MKGVVLGKEKRNTSCPLVEEEVDVVLVGGLGEGRPYNALGDNLVLIYRLPKSVEIREAIHLLTQNLLKNAFAD